MTQKWKINKWALQFLTNEKKNIFSFAEYILFTIDEGFYC